MYFGRDLIKHYDTFFNEATLKSHAESEKRRQARPLRAESNLGDATKQPQQRRSLMSFMRSNNEEKWNMIFQRNGAGTTSATSSSSAASVASSERVSSSSFTRPTPMTSGTATMQDSPPLSPVKAPAPPPPSEEASNSAPEKQQVEKKKNEEEDNDKKEPTHDEKDEKKKKEEDDASEQAPAKDTVVFDVVQESRKDNDEALDPFFDDED